jgi:hypothetical protein
MIVPLAIGHLLMAEVITCPTCSRKLQLPDELLGQLVKCPGCARTFQAAREGAAPRPAPRQKRIEQPRPAAAPARPLPVDQGLPDLRLAPDESYQRTIVVFSLLGGVLSAGLMVLLFFRAVAREEQTLSVILLVSPLAGFVIGSLGGFGLAGMLAPAAFYETEKGRSWLRRIGTRWPLMARLACLLLVLATGVVLLAMFFFLWL